MTRARRPLVGVAAGALGVALLFSCQKAAKPPVSPPVPATYFTAKRTDARFYTANHMLASIEMQVTGEPFAQLLGRNLAGYNRFSPTSDEYIDPDSGAIRTDVLGYATAIESYEYSKQPMNNLSFESGAGLSLQFAPDLNPQGVTGDPAYELLVQRLQHLGDAAHATGPTNFVVQPPPLANPLNYYGWPGFWPQFAEFRSFDPSIKPPAGAAHGCTFAGGYAAAASGAQIVGDYECGYNGLNLTTRDAQVEKVIEPAAMGYATWKQGLWVINYWQSLHDPGDGAVVAVTDADLPMVGQPGNLVVGQTPDPNDPTGTRTIPSAPGVYLGDITIEGWQGLVMIEEMTNKAKLLLSTLTTADGATLGGFATIKDALDYSATAPLRWWPSATAVTETATATTQQEKDKLFPQPTAMTVQSATSRLRDLTALAAGFGTFYALTDFTNPSVGGQIGSRATFDGDPFAADNQKADGEDTPHDRALGVIKVAVVNLERLHLDPQRKVLVDEVSVSGGAGQRGSTVNTVDAAYTIVGLRQALRAISGTLALYSNDTPDTRFLTTALDGTAGGAIGERIRALLIGEADFLAGKLIAADGAVANGWDLAADAADASPTKIESEAAAIRGLLDAYLATSNERYRTVAVRVYADLEKRFWMAPVRAFRTVAGVDDQMHWTPVAFGTLEGALRQYWKLVARRPGQERVANELLERLKRTFKLVVNGWDDANADDVVENGVARDDKPAPSNECTGAGLQMGERALTGEFSRPGDKGDRDHDCVPEISSVGLPAALAGEIVLERRK